MVKIDKGVPLPPAGAGRRRKYPFMDMVPGDSFFLPAKEHEAPALRNRIAAAARAARPGYLWTSRVEDGGVRVWLVRKK